ncbi:murein hydrolase activator NlpD [Siccibacter colletis]|uniref:murein hydrolase activator NlpD n=1 Tax=Siccibacter colletis TaxID=1505757 RepID=UPI0004E10A5F|nr:murein hydrolase activator NlpD [Siccibacter colletis]
MSTGSPLHTARRAVTLSLIALAVASCSNNNTSQAPISSVGGNAGTESSGGMLVTQPPKMGTVSPAPAPQIQSAQPVISAPVSQPAPVQNTIAEPVQTQNGRIVYNRQYGNIPKGSYTGGNTYTVKRGDTLFYIAWITGNDFRDLAQRNGVAAPYSLTVGQTLEIENASGRPITPGNTVSAADASAQGLATKPAQNSTRVVASQPTITYSENSGEQSANKMLPGNKSAGTVVTAPVTAPVVSTTEPVASSQTASAPVSSWRWPTDGKVIENFSSSEGGNRGIDIAGSKGQSITATADGRVVYAGNALRGYGNLIIIKHNDDYLSAYAHNDTMLVREQQEVKAGQKIATMGSTGTSSTRLHFEIRYKGKSVNPLQFLPQR